MLVLHMIAWTFGIEFTTSFPAFHHLRPALYEKLPRKRHEEEHTEEETPICTRQGTGKRVRRPQLER